MSNNELARAFRMRLEGRSFSEIGAELYYAPDTVYQQMLKTVRGDRRKYPLKSEAYPDLANYIVSRYNGCIREFSRVCGVPTNTLSDMLRGARKPKQTTIDRIRAFAGNVV